MTPVPPLSLAAIRQPAFLYAPDGRISVANDLAEALAGRPLSGCSAADIITHFNHRHPGDRRFVPEELPPTRALAGEEAIDVPIEITAADGRTVHILATASPIRESGGIVGALVVWQDVTALAAANAELDRQHRLLDAILATVPYRVSLWDRDERIVWANERFAADRGEPREALVGRSWWELDAPSGVVEPLVREALDAVLAGATFAREVEVAGTDGREWRACTFMPFGRDAFLVITEDVSERKRAEVVEARLRALLDNNPCLVFLKDEAGRYVYLNETYERQFVHTKDWFGKTDLDFWPKESVELFRENDLGVLASGQAQQFLEDSTDRAGTRHCWLNYKFPFTDANGERFVGGIGIDATARVRAEEALAESEERYRSLVENSIDAVLLTAPDGSILAANPEASRIFGMTEEELIRGGRDAIMDTADPDPRIAPALEERNRTGRFRGELTLRRKDGTLFPGEVASALFRDRSGAVRTTMIVRDITARKEAEAARQEYAERLRASNEELQRFAYVASHDLQEPLRSIVSFSQLLNRRYRGRFDADADEYLGFIVEGGNRMQALIQDLLQVSRVETEAKPLEPTEMGEVVAGALRLLEAPIREAGGAVLVDSLPRVMADATQLEQVFTNLIGNAIKYRRPEVPPEIRVSAERHGDWWEFAVADNGIGIAAEYFDRIFEMFRRLHTHDEYDGTGIGLAVVKRIVERHGGRIRVESTPGEGSTFFFTLPAA